MSPAVLALLATIDPVAILMDRAARTHRAMTAATVTVSAVTVRGEARNEARSRLRYRRPDGLEVTLSFPPTLPVVRTVFAGDGQTVVLDPKLKQYVRAPFEANEEAPAALKRVEPSVDDLVLALAEGEGVAVWLGRFRSLKSWTWHPRGSEAVLRHEAGTTKMAIVLGRHDRRLSRVSVTTPEGTTTWTLQYGTPPGQFRFEPPAGAYAVRELDPMVVPPTFADAAARQATERMFRFYDRPTRLSFEITGSEARTEVWIEEGRVRQRDAQADWSYDGDTLTLVDRLRRTVYTGPARMNDVIDAVAATGTRIDPMVHTLMRGVNPYRAVLGRKAHIKVTGRTTSPTGSATLLRAESPAAFLSFVVRDRDGMVLSVATETRDPEGRTLATQTRQFRHGVPGGAAPVAPTEFTRRPLRDLLPGPRS